MSHSASQTRLGFLMSLLLAALCVGRMSFGRNFLRVTARAQAVTLPEAPTTVRALIHRPSRQRLVGASHVGFTKLAGHGRILTRQSRVSIPWYRLAIGLLAGLVVAGGLVSVSGIIARVTPSGASGEPTVVSMAAGGPAAGGGSAYAVTSDGNVYAWGNNSSGQLGNGTTTSSTEPVEVDGVGGSGNLTHIVQVVTGGSITYAISASGNVYSWGTGATGTLGDGAGGGSDTPVEVVGVGGSGHLSGVIQIDLIGGATAALTSSGNVYAWGANNYGQVGDCSLTGVGSGTQDTPVEVRNTAGYLNDIVDIEGDYNAGYALTGSGYVYAWGFGGQGELGNGGYSNSCNPTLVDGVGGTGSLSGVTEVTSSDQGAYALTNSGNVYEWGVNVGGFGSGGSGSSDEPTPVELVTPDGSGYLSGITQIASSYGDGGSALTGDGHVISWPNPSDGYLTYEVPGVGGSGYLSGVTEIVPNATIGTTVALTADGLYTWGYGLYGELGDGTTSNSADAVEVEGVGGSGYLSGTVLASNSVFYVGNSSGIYSWGSGPDGELGDGTTTYTQSTPVQVDDLGGFSSPEETQRDGRAIATSDVALQKPCGKGDPVDCSSGDFYESFTDVSVPGRGPALDLTRTYNSLDAGTKGIFGYGWSSSYDMNLVVNGDSSVTITSDDGSQVTAEPDGSGGFTLPAWTDTTLTTSGGNYDFFVHQKMTYSFNSSGELTAITDLNGYSTSLSYSSGKLTTVTDPAGRTISFSYGTNGLVSQISDPDSQNTSYYYDSSDNLSSVTDPLSRVTSFTYDSAHLMLTSTSPNGQSGGPDAGDTLTNTYDSSGRVLTQTDPTGLTTTFGYFGDNFSLSGGTTTITDPHGNVEYERYTDGELVSLTNGVGTSSPSTWRYGYDSDTLEQTTSTDPDGNTTTDTYGTNGNLTSSTDALGNTTSYTYNSLGEPLTVTDPLGITTTYTYDSDGNELTKTVTGVSTVGSGSPWSWSGSDGPEYFGKSACASSALCVMLGGPGDLLTTTDPTSAAWSSAEIDPGNGLVAASCPSTTLCVVTDGAGNVLTSTDPTGGASTWTSVVADTSAPFSSLSCPSTSLCVAGDYSGNVIVSTDPTGDASAWSTSSLDSDGWLVGISCSSTTFCAAVDNVGNIFTSTDPADGTWSSAVEIDSASQPAGVSCPSATLCVVTDEAGNVVTSTDPTGDSSAWTSAAVNPDYGFASAPSCPSTTLCVVGDWNGDVFTSTYPSGGAGSWSETTIDSGEMLPNVFCPSTTLCVADNDGVFVSTDPTGGGSAWSVAFTSVFSSVSCSTKHECVAVDGTGSALSTTDSERASWSSPASIDPYPLSALSCPTVGLCAAVDDVGNVVTSTDPTGGSSSWSSPANIDGPTRLTAISCHSSTFCAAVDDTGNVVTSTDPTGGSSSWSPADIDGTTPLAGVSCPTSSLCAAVDDVGNVVTSTAPGAGSSSWSPADIDGSTRLTAISCATSSFCAAVDDVGNVLISTSPTGGASAWSEIDIDASTPITSISCHKGAAATIFCAATDSLGNVLTTVDPAGGSGSWSSNDVADAPPFVAISCDSPSECVAVDQSYILVGEALITSNPETTYTYGDSGHPGDVTEVTDPAGHVTDYTYDSFGDTASTTTHPSSGVSDTTDGVYDVLGRKVCEASPNATASSVTCPSAGSSRVSDTTTYSYNADGELTSETNARGKTTSYDYDADGNQTSVTDAESRVTENDFDADDRPTSVTTGYGSSVAATTDYAYDIVPGTSPCSGSVTGATYCTRTADPNGLVTVDYYDAQNRLIEETTPESGTTTHTYDLAGNLLTTTSAAGTTTYGYDADNRVVSAESSSTASGFSTTPDVFYGYDADGNRNSMYDGTGSTSYTYDALERLVSVTDGSGDMVSYSYNPDGQVTSITYPNGLTVGRKYDGAGRLVSVSDFQNRKTTFGYDADGNLTSTTYPNSTTVSQTFNADDEVLSIALAPTMSLSSPTATFSYDRDDADLVTSETDTGSISSSTSYTYDADSRVATEGSDTLGYDTGGDPTTLIDGTSQDFGTSGQLTSSTTGSATTTYGYDGIGDRVSTAPPSAAASSFGYDQTGELVTATPSGGDTYSYAYNGDGLRITETDTDTSVTDTYAYDTVVSASGLALLLTDGTTDFIYGPDDQVIEQEDSTSSGSPQFYVDDQLDSTRLLVNLSGSIDMKATYDAFGNVTSSSGTASTPIGYAGAYADSETGLLYLIHRYYDPTTAQFLTVDPLLAQTHNPYGYAADDPTTESDPGGLDTFGECAGVQGTAGNFAGTMTICIVRTANQKQVALTVTGSSPVLGTLSSSAIYRFVVENGGIKKLFGVNANLSIQTSNANCVQALGGEFGVKNYSVGIPWGVSISHAGDQAGTSVYSFGGGFDPGISFSAGTEYTSVTEETGSVRNEINGAFNEQENIGLPELPILAA
jgi:RHS repeat-associated protein